MNILFEKEALKITEFIHLSDIAKKLKYQIYSVNTLDETTIQKFVNIKDIIFFGTISGLKLVQKYIPSAKVWCDWDELRCFKYIPKIKDYTIHKNHMFLPFSSLYGYKQLFGSSIDLILILLGSIDRRRLFDTCSSDRRLPLAGH